MRVYIPLQFEFYKYYKDCKKLYEELQSSIKDENSFDFIVSNTFFYLFTNDADKLLGGIYYFLDDGKLYVNAFAHRNSHLQNLECFRTSLDWFDCDIYARPQNKLSKLCLYRCGFKPLASGEFVYEK